MMKGQVLGVVVGALLLASCASGGGGAGPTAGEFCPSCKGFCGASCPKDDKGNCKACGHAPVKANACVLSWFWCSTHTAWHANAPCGENASKKCCEEHTATAMCVKKGTAGVTKGKYCLMCHGCCGPECPMDDKGNCKACGKPPVETDVLERSWFWCTAHGTWHDAACGDNAAKKCCTEAKVKIPACWCD